MTLDFEHFLITRFNVKNADWKVDKSGVTVRDDLWTYKRLQLFESVCLPSIQHQSVKGFKWLIYLDCDTNDEVRKRMLHIQLTNSFIHTKYINGMSGFVETVREDIRRLLQAHTSYLITTRIDNDDAFHECAIANIQSAFERQKLEVINLLEGIQWDLNNNNFYYAFNESNPFITLIERLEDNTHIKSVFYKEHRHYAEKPDKDLKMRQFCGEPMWLQVIHDSNISNKIEGQPILKEGVLDLFNVKS
ncbi:putative rhamnosyl transferase [Fulvivirga ulvae]|uniref:glycosyltransferase n=1 Tax=Fulvivirga ulvae TaxID=2904245 RepID=UPI001F30C9E1|nr:glycosyltransferase [Fulvivirga ulvae]UII31848.1 putative rhamnosyl transferase [Fulvivirga ulvae]